jgi:hypothetical protein
LLRLSIHFQVVAKLGASIEWDSAKIRLSTNQGANAKHIIKRSVTITLQEMLNTGYFNQNNSPGVLFYEMLDITLQDLETKRYLKIFFVDQFMKEQVILHELTSSRTLFLFLFTLHGLLKGPHDILVLKSAKAGEVIDKFRPVIASNLNVSGQLRLLEVSNYKIHKTFNADDFISSISEFSTLYIEVNCSKYKSEYSNAQTIGNSCRRIENHRIGATHSSYSFQQGALKRAWHSFYIYFKEGIETCFITSSQLLLTG